MMDFLDDFVVNDPLIFCYFIEGEFDSNVFRFGSHSWFFGFTKFGVFECYRIVFTEFGVLEFFHNCNNSLFVCIGLDRI